MNIELKKLCKFYKGETECPYNQDTQIDKYMFWHYEKMFEHNFYEAKTYQYKKIEQAFAEYLSDLFPALSDKYVAMDNGIWFKELYERLDP